MKKKIFILLGVFIGFLALFYGINISQKTSIYVSGSEIKNLINIWEDQTGRLPTNKEIDMIIKNLVNEEILYQEALKLGLNKNDKIIKRRLIQKLEFYKESENLNKVIEENIIEYYNEYINSKDVTRKRLYIDSMEKVLGDVDKVILDQNTDGGQGVVPYLPLNQLRTGSNN